jgi:hypothetical protein
MLHSGVKATTTNAYQNNGTKEVRRDAAGVAVGLLQTMQSFPIKQTLNRFDS